MLLLFDEQAVLLDLFLHAKNLNVYRVELFPEALVFEDLVVDFSDDVLFALEALLIGQEHFKQRAKWRGILGMQLHAEGIEAILSALEARPQLLIVGF